MIKIKLNIKKKNTGINQIVDLENALYTLSQSSYKNIDWCRVKTRLKPETDY